MTGDLKRDINGALEWSFAIPVLAFWPLISFLPVFGLFKAEATILSISVDLVFMATSFIGLYSMLVGLRWIGGPAFRASRDAAPKRGRAFAAAAYGAAWMLAYGAWAALA